MLRVRAYKLPSVVPIDKQLAESLYSVSPDRILVRLLVSDGAVATLVPVRDRDHINLG